MIRVFDVMTRILADLETRGNQGSNAREEVVEHGGGVEGTRHQFVGRKSATTVKKQGNSHNCSASNRCAADGCLCVARRCVDCQQPRKVAVRAAVRGLEGGAGGSTHATKFGGVGEEGAKGGGERGGVAGGE